MPPKTKAKLSSTRAVELAASVNAAMGKDSVIMGNDPYLTVTYLPTEIEPMDDLLQGGLPFGRFVEIFGDYSTLKSYVGYKAIASAQKKGMLAALIDTEHSFDPKWAEDIGVNTKELIYRQPENGEKAIDLAEVLIRGGVDIIVFDSVAAALPKSEQQLMLGGDKNVQPARLAQLMSLAMRKLTAANKKTTVLWINQTRVNVGVMFGTNETVPGGKALPFYACLSPDTKVLTANYKWVPLWSVQKGDELVGFDEFPEKGAHGRKFRRATVTGMDRIKKLSYEITTDKGTSTIASAEHQWLVLGGPPSKRRGEWKLTHHLLPGDEILWFGEPWQTPSDILNPLEDVYDAAYLSGIFDGEGTVNLNMRTRSENNRGFAISMCQLPGLVLEKTKACLSNLGFEYRENLDKGNGTIKVTILGTLHERMRFLGQIDPVRLTSKVASGWEGASPLMRGRWKENETAKVVSVKHVGMQEVYAIGTNTETLMADGMFSHNSYRIALRKAGKVTEEVSVYVLDKGKPTKKNVKQTVAQSIRATVEKSKLNAPYRDVMFNFDFRNGCVDEWLYLCYKALDLGLISYERGMWWVLDGKIPKKYRGRIAFEEKVGMTEIREMLNPKVSKSLGVSPPVKSKAVSVKRKSSKVVVPKRTRTVVRAVSSSTAATRKTSSKSKTRIRVIRSTKHS